MNHPKPEEWVPYVFGEATGTAKRELRAHLRNCQQCRAEVDTWKRSLGRPAILSEDAPPRVKTLLGAKKK